MDNIIYNEYVKKIRGEQKLECCSNKEVDKELDVLLSFLPNGGKLYKYRSFEKGKFDNYYNALKDGYLWFPQAERLNDDFDTTLFYNPEAEKEKIKDYLLSHQWLYFKLSFKYDNSLALKKCDIRDKRAFKTILDCYDIDTCIFDSEKAIRILMKSGVGFLKVKQYVQNKKQFIENYFIDHPNELGEILERFIRFNENIRKGSYVYSMSETYDSNPLWAFYANNNQGFCIEYDYNKARELALNKKKLVLNTFRVDYSDSIEEFSFIDMIKYVMSGQKDKQLFVKSNLDTFKHMMRKLSDWAFEKEWRIMLCNLEDNKVYLDLVSKIIIDERVLETEESKKLIGLCKQKGWDVLVRKTQHINVAHKFEKLI